MNCKRGILWDDRIKKLRNCGNTEMKELGGKEIIQNKDCKKKQYIKRKGKEGKRKGKEGKRKRKRRERKGKGRERKGKEGKR